MSFNKSAPTGKSPKTVSIPSAKNIPLNLSGKSTLPARPDRRRSPVRAAGGAAVASVVPGASTVARGSGLPVQRGPAHPLTMGSKSRETIYGGSVRAAAERATEARKAADLLAVEAWNKRMLGFQGPAQPSPTLGDAINAGFGYLEVKCLGCNTHQTVALDIVRRPKATQHRSMSWSGTCAAASARRCAAIRTNAAIWWRCERRRFRPVIRRQRGGRASDDV